MVLCRASSLQPWVENCSSLPILLHIVYYATCAMNSYLIHGDKDHLWFDNGRGHTDTFFMLQKTLLWLFHYSIYSLRNACLRAMHSETHKMQLECLPWVCIHTLLVLLFVLILQNVNRKAVHSFRHVSSYCNSHYALAGLIREIRNDYLCIPGIIVDTKHE